MADTDTSPIQFIVKEKSLIGNEIHEAGAIVTLPVGTLPADNLEAVDARGQALKDEYVASNKARIAKMNENFATPGSGVDPAALGALIQAAVKDAIAAQAAENADLTARLDALQAQIDATGKKQPALA